MKQEAAPLIENYMYLYHTDQFILLPVYPSEVTDTLQANFNSTPILARTAPIVSYASSGPRAMSINLDLHRDMMWDLNYGVSNLALEIGDDYIDTLIKQIQAIALPKYSTTTKMINPPMIALRFGNEIYIKGVISGNISISYSGPLGSDNKYKSVRISFGVQEIDPYDADTVQIGGSFRGLSRSLERRLFKS